MNRLILADNQTIFRTGAARVLALEDDMRIVAQCEDTGKLWSAVESFRASILLVGSSLKLDMAALIAKAHAQGSRIIAVAERTELLSDEVIQHVHGILHRNVGGTELLDCVRRVARGERYIQHSSVTPIHVADRVGERVRDMLTPREMQIVGLIIQGCKNKEIASQLGTKEQVVKNYLRGIYDKTGVSDRLELALFTVHHRVLAEAATRAGEMIERKSA
ncbi:MAG: response regulator transcription factor [Acidobacteriaceae bacterium]|nr:response regulator transcription factor [Acidobacteriaceae bacterium]